MIRVKSNGISKLYQLVQCKGCSVVFFILFKGALSWYGKLTWESAHAWNLIILCLLFDLVITVIFMVHLSFYAIPLLIYDVMYDITTIPQGTQL